MFDLALVQFTSSESKEGALLLLFLLDAITLDHGADVRVLELGENDRLEDREDEKRLDLQNHESDLLGVESSEFYDEPALDILFKLKRQL